MVTKNHLNRCDLIFFPRFDEKDVYEGAFFYAQSFLFLSLLEYIEGESPYTINLIHSDNQFSQRERQIIFFTLQRLSRKEVGRKLNLSHRTIENNLQSIYQKSGCIIVGNLESIAALTV